MAHLARQGENRLCWANGQWKVICTGSRKLPPAKIGARGEWIIRRRTTRGRVDRRWANFGVIDQSRPLSEVKSSSSVGTKATSSGSSPPGLSMISPRKVVLSRGAGCDVGFSSGMISTDVDICARPGSALAAVRWSPGRGGRFFPVSAQTLSPRRVLAAVRG